MPRHQLSLALCLALSCAASITAHAAVSAVEAPLPAAPAEAASSADVLSDANVATDFDRIVVTATRTERALVDVPNTVDVIDRQRMDDTLTRDLRDLFRYEPGITVGSGFGRFGLGDIRIRGLGGNRVRIQTDGIAVADAFLIGSFSNANRNFVDTDTLKRVEVVRGPTSALYGSDALGGVVSFVTKDPSDYLKDGKDAYVGFRLGYQGQSDGLSGSATTAFGGERWSGLVAVSHRQGREVDNQGDDDSLGAARTAPNPQSTDGRILLAKLVFAPSATQRVRLTVEGNEDATDTDVLTSRGFQPLTGATTSSLLGDDHQTRARISLEHELDAVDTVWADRLDWQVYRQDSETTQRTVELRRTAAGRPERRAREFNFDQRVVGVQANAHKSFDTGSLRHTLSYGLDVARTDTRQKRDGRVTNLLTGVSSPTVSPDVFPVRDFPISETTNAALYVQDEIVFANDRLRLIPALRVDRYELRPDIDTIFAEDNPGVAAADYDKTNVSPKLGAVWHFAHAWSLFGGYARGFRSPPYSDVNVGFTNLQFGYTAIANPDLKPETSDGFELGVRMVGERGYASLTAYDNRYQDFIESNRFVGINAAGLQVFQSQNVADARIHGVELKAGVQLGGVSDALDGWSLRGAAAYARGENRSEGVPLDSVDPLTATLGLGYESDRWGAELAGRFVAGKDRVSDASLYAQSGSGVLDVFAHWQFAPGATVNAGMFNLADRTYTEAGNVPLVVATSGTLDRYTSPGRNLSVSLAVEW